MPSLSSDVRTVVTGGSSGLGAAVVRLAREAGQRVVTIDRQAADADTVIADLSIVDEARSAILTAIERLGGIDNLVLSAGINRPGLASEVNADVMASIVQVNLIGAMVTAATAIPELERAHGRIVFIGSTVSRRGNSGHAAYAASKFGIAGFMESLGYELRGRVGLTLISPGTMDTGLFEGRSAEWMPRTEIMMSAQTVADAVMFALSQPAGVSVRELVITHYDAPDWP
jgi:2-dehydro-3-deoxy-L-rhamnonate dehydrogenase (NAD+)